MEAEEKNMLTTHRHVGPAPCIPGLCYGVDKMAADAKVTKLDGPLPVQQDVGRLHICTNIALAMITCLSEGFTSAQTLHLQ